MRRFGVLRYEEMAVEMRLDVVGVIPELAKKRFDRRVV